MFLPQLSDLPGKMLFLFRSPPPFLGEQQGPPFLCTYGTLRDAQSIFVFHIQPGIVISKQKLVKPGNAPVFIKNQVTPYNYKVPDFKANLRSFHFRTACAL